ncbi:MAG TPA: tyrosine-protein phosphatase [Blastocatellia bacterium]|nr:tyrosine-protein phosphatase [Blastocatellia bacterium]
MYTKKFLLALLLSVLPLGIATSALIRKGPGHPAAKGAHESPGKAANAGPLDDLSPEVKSGLPHFYRLNESYTRGAAPSGEGVKTLQRLGIKTLVDLRSNHDHTEEIKAEAEVLGLSYHRVPLSVWYGPSDSEAKEFLSIVADRSRGPFYVFCSDGMHRTGEMSAIYRIDREQWKIGRALKEMDEIGFKSYYYALRNYVWTYARKFRPEAVPPTARRLIPLDEWDHHTDRSPRPR